MTLREKQSQHVVMVAKLIFWAIEHGYQLTWGDAYRDPRVHGAIGQKLGYGHAKSCHKLRLAVDFNLFRDGQLLTSEDDYRPLCVYWESIGGTSGIHFSDANHFSLEHEGMR